MQLSVLLYGALFAFFAHRTSLASTLPVNVARRDGGAGLTSRPEFEELYTRQASNYSNPDGFIMNYLLYWAYYQVSFWDAAFSKITPAEFASAGYPDMYQGQFHRIAAQKAQIVNTITKLEKENGIKPFAKCSNYSHPFTNATNFIYGAFYVESYLAVNTFLGAAPFLKNQTVLTAMFEIATAQAKAASFFRSLFHFQPLPNYADTAAAPADILSTAGQFVNGCPKNSSIAFKKLAYVEVKPQLNVTGGTPIVLDITDPVVAKNLPKTDVYCSWKNGPLNTRFTSYDNTKKTCVLPKTVDQGTVLLALVNSSVKADQTTMLAASSLLEKIDAPQAG